MVDIEKLFGARFPIVQAPMAGGPSTAALASEVSRAGALGSIAAAYSSPAGDRRPDGQGARDR